jgi:hypothetical protein
MRAMPPFLLSAAAAALLAGCSYPEARLRAGLINAGLPPPLAGCMAGRMVDRLSLAELRRIGDLPEAREAASVGEFLHNVRALRDPHILSVSASAVALCASGLVT